MTARVAVVTGANRGIGREVARQLALRGEVVVLGARDPTKGERAAAGLAREGAPVLPRQLDVTDQASLETLTILARPLARSSGRKACTARQAPSRLVRSASATWPRSAPAACCQVS